MFGKLYSYDEVNYRLFCYKGSIHKFKFEFTICDECETGSSSVSTTSEANELDRVVGVLLCQAQDRSRAVKSIKTASFLITVAEKPWKIGRQVGFRLRGRELKVHDVMFVVNVVSKHRKQHPPKIFVERESQRNLTEVRDDPACLTAAKVVDAGRAQKDKNERPADMECEEIDANCSPPKRDERKRKMAARELPTQRKKSSGHSVGGVSKDPVHPPRQPGSHAYSLEVPHEDEDGNFQRRLRKTPQRAGEKERVSRQTRTGSSKSPPSKRSLLIEASHRASSSPRKSPRLCTRHPRSPPPSSTSPGRKQQHASAGTGEARQTRSKSLLKDDDLRLVHPKGDEFVRQEYEKEEMRLRNLAKPVTSSSERRSFLRSL